jgi:hypothetical protein
MDFIIRNKKQAFMVTVFTVAIICSGTSQIYQLFENGFVDKGMSFGFKQVDADRIMVTTWLSPGNNEIGDDIGIILDKENLDVLDTTVIISTNSDVLKQGTVKFFDNPFPMRLEFGLTSDTNTQILNMYRVDEDRNKTSLVFSKQYHHIHPHTIGFSNNEIIVVYESGIMYRDTINIDIYDITGNLIISKSYNNVVNPQIWGENIFGRFFEPIEHPLIPNAFVLGSDASPRIYVLNQNTLDTIQTFDARYNSGYLANSGMINRWEIIGDPSNNDLIVNEVGVSLGGTATTMPYYFSNGDVTVWDDQFYEIRYRWDGEIDVWKFGPIDTNNLGRTLAINEVTGTHVLGGNIPREVLAYEAAEKRRVVAYIYDDHGKMDSIVLFGEGNHVPTDIFVDDNGDVFLTGFVSNAWSDKKVYAWVVKIPEIAVGIIEQSVSNKYLEIYPNPTTDYLRIKQSDEMLNGTYEIYNQQGKMVVQDRYTQEPVPVSQLPSGTYIFVGRSLDGKQYNSLFIKQ